MDLYKIANVTLKSYKSDVPIQAVEVLQAARGRVMTTRQIAQQLDMRESDVQVRLEDEFSNGKIEHAVNDRTGQHEWRYPIGPAPRGWY